MWKIVGGHLVSKYLGAKFGVHEDIGPVVFISQENIDTKAYVDFTFTSPTIDPLIKGINIHWCMMVTIFNF